ncbi:hypothetical protein SGPA1_12401 [Streptomyces misionensis JCM 4497]
MRGPGPYGRLASDHGGGAARVRLRHGARRRGGHAARRPGGTVLVARAVGGGRAAGHLAGPARRADGVADRCAARGGRLAGRAARGVVPGGGAAAGRRMGAGAARFAVGPGGGRPGRGVPGGARQAAGHTGSRRTGRVGRRVHRDARTVGGVPAARRVRGAMGRPAGPGRGGRPQHRAGRRELSVELQRGDGARGALSGPGGGHPAAGAARDARRTGGRGAGRWGVLGGGVPAARHHTAAAGGDGRRADTEGHHRCAGAPAAAHHRLRCGGTPAGAHRFRDRGTPVTMTAVPPRALGSAPGGRRLGDVLAHPLHDRRGRRPRGEDLRDALLLQRRDVLLRDDAAAEDEDVLGVALLEQVDDRGEQGVVRAGQNGQSNGVRVLLEGGVDDLLRRLVEAGVDDLHPGVAQGARDDLGAAVVAVEARLGDHHADRTGCHTHHCLHHPSTEASASAVSTSTAPPVRPATRREVNERYLQHPATGGFTARDDGELTQWDM